MVTFSTPLSHKTEPLVEWFAVMVSEDGRPSAYIYDGWFCNEETTRKLYEERKASKQFKEVLLVKVVDSKRSFMPPNGNEKYAKYVSVHDDSVVCESTCWYNTKTKVVSNIEEASNGDDAIGTNAMTDEYVKVYLPGTEDESILRASDGVTFDY